MKNKTEYIDDYLKDLEDMVIDAIKKPTKDEVIYELGKHLRFHLFKIRDTANKMYENEKESIREVLGDEVLISKRAWSAWDDGTMTREDFLLASEDESLVEELCNAVY
ncbi:MAG: hypothetical protein PF569_08590 [Candidatus Woesearchaeota archaeon]|jgi:hypothetical protein|nr:hypothetical protein [Candidatus Woesearchaeota archaeon]